VKIIIVIPARLKSTRLKEKMLKPIKGKPLVWYTYYNAQKSKSDDVVIATDSIKIKKILEKLNCNVIMTSKKHKSGTDRVGEVSRKIYADYYINLQGDEPLIKPQILNKIIDYIKKHKNIEILTVVKKTKDIKEIKNSAIVKVVIDKNQNALYFSRAPVPFNRDNLSNIYYYKHFGIYCYRRDILQKITKLKQSYLEKIEKLEQLRWLENGYRIKVIETKYDTIGVDTEEDFRKVKKIIRMLNNSKKHNFNFKVK